MAHGHDAGQEMTTIDSRRRILQQSLRAFRSIQDALTCRTLQDMTEADLDRIYDIAQKAGNLIPEEDE